MQIRVCALKYTLGFISPQDMSMTKNSVYTVAMVSYFLVLSVLSCVRTFNCTLSSNE